jgi:hypothetical protein
MQQHAKAFNLMKLAWTLEEEEVNEIRNKDLFQVSVGPSSDPGLVLCTFSQAFYLSDMKKCI